MSRSIAAVFQDPRRGLRLTPKVLAAQAGVSVPEARAALKRYAAAQTTRRFVRPRDEDYAPTGGLPGTYQADVVFLEAYEGVNDRRNSIVTLINANTRYVYARALTNRKAKTLLAALDDILLENGRDVQEPIRVLVTDGGSEWKKEVGAYLRRARIEHIVAEPRTHKLLGRVDRFHRTLRMLVGRYFAVSGNDVWVDALPALIEGYNRAPHRALEWRAPRDIDAAAERDIRLRDLARAKRVKTLVDRGPIRPGTRVRYLLNRFGAFRKGTEPTWSSTVHRVRARLGVDTFSLEGLPPNEVKVWAYYELQPVSGRVIEPPQTRVRGTFKAPKPKTATRRRQIRRELPVEERGQVLSQPRRR